MPGIGRRAAELSAALLPNQKTNPNRNTLLYAVESFFVYDCGNGIGNYYVAEFVFSDILAVGENAKHGVILHIKALMLNAALVE